MRDEMRRLMVTFNHSQEYARACLIGREDSEWSCWVLTLHRVRSSLWVGHINSGRENEKALTGSTARAVPALQPFNPHCYL